MKIALASDHAGYELKEKIKQFITAHECIDFGSYDANSMDYPDTGFLAATAVSNGDCKRGILVCGSGIGMSIVANKVPGVRAALCYTEKMAELSRLHNNANVLVLPGRFISSYLAADIIKIWLATEFEAGRHLNRINKIKKYEDEVK